MTGRPRPRPHCLPGCNRLDSHDGRDAGACMRDGVVMPTPPGGQPKPPAGPRLGSVPRRNRGEVRHTLQEVYSRVQGLRTCMPYEDLSLNGALSDLDDLIKLLEHCKRELGWRPPALTADHSKCTEVPALSGKWQGHTHEGQTGWWLFPQEVA